MNKWNKTKWLLLKTFLFFCVLAYLSFSFFKKDYAEDYQVGTAVPFGPITAENPFVSMLGLSETKGFAGISLQLATYARLNTGKLQFWFKDKLGNVLHQQALDAQDIEDNQFRFFAFDLPNVLPDNSIDLEIHSDSNDPNNAITIWVHEHNQPNLIYKYEKSVLNNNKLLFLFIIALLTLLLYVFTVVFPVCLEKFVLIQVLFFGTMSMFVMPISSIPDEGAHFNRIFHLSQGGGAHQPLTYSLDLDRALTGVWLTQKGDGIGVLAEKPYGYVLTKKYTKDERQNMPAHGGAASYSFVNYIPQILGFLFGSFIYDNPLTLIYLGRFFALLFFAYFVYYALRLMPNHKLFLATVILLPMTIHQVASLSADSFNFAIIFLFFAYLVFAYQYSLNNKQFVTLAFLMGFLALLKINLLTLSVFVVFIPYQHLPKQAKFTKFFLLVFTFLLALFWVSLSAKNLLSLRSGYESLSVALLDIFSNPIRSFTALLNTFSILGQFYLKSMVGVFGWLNIYMQNWHYYMLYFSMFVALCIDTPVDFCKRKRFLSFALCFAFVLLIELLLYATWTPKGNDFIEGVQGRYFIPVLPFFAFIFSNRFLSKWSLYVEEFVKMILMISLYIYIVKVLNFYY